MKDFALAYQQAGWPVIPCGPDKKALVQWDEYQTSLPTPEQVTQWWTAWPQAMIGVPLGKVSGLIRVDVDNADAALQGFGGMPETAEFTTPSGGRGYLLQYEAWVRTKVLWTGDNQHQELRVQSNGAYTIVPPSPGYHWVRQTPIARAPRWLLNWFAEHAMRDTPSVVLRVDLRDDELCEALSHISPDGYDTWVQVGMALKSRDAFQMWEDWSRGSPKFKEGECERKWNSFNGAGLTVATVVHLAKEGGWKPVWSPYEPLTEGGNANVLARVGADRALWSPKLGWLAWDGRRWTSGDAAECLVQEMQKDSLRVRRCGVLASMSKLTEHTLDAEVKRRAKTKVLSKIDSLDKATCYHGSRELAKSAMVCDHEQFDKHPTLLNFLNGTLDLVDGSLRPHNPCDRLTTLVPHDYDPKAQAPQFARFLERSVPDAAVREYLRLKLGSTLLGRTRKELLILWGPDGDNGKTLLVEAVLHALGPDYGVKCASSLLLKRSFGDDDRNTVMLHNKRFAAASETNEGAKLNEALLKELTGGDKITTRKLYHEKFTFEPTHDIVYVTNHKPVLHGTDSGLWSRIKLVEFPVSFPVGHKDRVEGLRSILEGEACGLLTWLVAACLDAAGGIAEPQAVLETTATYRQEHNPIARFIQERGYQKTDGSFKLLKSRVAEAYRAWAATNAANTPFNKIWFGRQMTAIGVGSDANYYHLQEGQG